MREEFNSPIKPRTTRPDSYQDDPAAETKLIGLPADAQLTMSLPEGHDYCNTTLTSLLLHQTFVKLSERDAKTHARPGIPTPAGPYTRQFN
jgi:hypothetical protein